MVQVVEHVGDGNGDRRRGRGHLHRFGHLDQQRRWHVPSCGRDLLRPLEGPNKTASYVSENPVQAARDDNTAPEFALTTETRVVTENSTGNVGSPLRATDDDGDILTYSIVTWRRRWQFRHRPGHGPVDG